jgi:hypothetical protein
MTFSVISANGWAAFAGPPVADSRNAVRRQTVGANLVTVFPFEGRRRFPALRLEPPPDPHRVLGKVQNSTVGVRTDRGGSKEICVRKIFLT